MRCVKSATSQSAFTVFDRQIRRPELPESYTRKTTTCSFSFSAAESRHVPLTARSCASSYLRKPKSNARKGEPENALSDLTLHAATHSILSFAISPHPKPPSMSEPAPTGALSTMSAGTGSRKAPIEPGTAFYTYEDIGVLYQAKLFDFGA